MKKFVLILLALMVSYPLQSSAQEKEIDRIIAVVNDEAITKNEFNTQAKVLRNQLESAEIPIPKQPLFDQKVLREMINQKLQLQAAQHVGIQVTNSELSEAIQQIAERNHMTVEELYDSLRQKGLSVDNFKKEIRNEMIIKQFQEKEVVSRISISQTEIDNFTQPNSENLSVYRVGDILISLSDNPSPEAIEQAKQKAISILDRLKKGADFNQEAMKLPYDLAVKGGDLGWRKLPELPEAFSSAIKTMHVGDLAGPIQTPNGFHVIKLIDLKSNLSSQKSEEFELQLIFIPQKKAVKESVDNTEQLIRKVDHRLKTGSDFSQLAKKYSQDKTTASQGGYKGWVSENALDPIISQSLKKLTVGQISSPLLTKEGWYIVKVLAKRQVQRFGALEKNKIQQLIFQRKIAEGIEAMINNLREEAYIQILSPQLDNKIQE